MPFEIGRFVDIVFQFLFLAECEEWKEDEITRCGSEGRIEWFLTRHKCRSGEVLSGCTLTVEESDANTCISDLRCKAPFGGWIWACRS